MRQGRKRNPALTRITVTYSFWENSETQYKQLSQSHLIWGGKGGGGGKAAHYLLTNTLRLFVEDMLWAWYVYVFIPYHFQSSHNRAMQNRYRCWHLGAGQAGTNVAGGRGWQ